MMTPPTWFLGVFTALTTLLILLPTPLLVWLLWVTVRRFRMVRAMAVGGGPPTEYAPDLERLARTEKRLLTVLIADLLIALPALMLAGMYAFGLKPPYDRLTGLFTAVLALLMTYGALRLTEWNTTNPGLGRVIHIARVATALAIIVTTILTLTATIMLR